MHQQALQICKCQQPLQLPLLLLLLLEWLVPQQLLAAFLMHLVAGWSGTARSNTQVCNICYGKLEPCSVLTSAMRTMLTQLSHFVTRLLWVVVQLYWLDSYNKHCLKAGVQLTFNSLARIFASSRSVTSTSIRCSSLSFLAFCK